MVKGDQVSIWLKNGREINGVFEQGTDKNIKVKCVGDAAISTWTIKHSAIEAFCVTVPRG